MFGVVNDNNNTVHVNKVLKGIMLKLKCLLQKQDSILTVSFA